MLLCHDVKLLLELLVGLGEALVRLERLRRDRVKLDVLLLLLFLLIGRSLSGPRFPCTIFPPFFCWHPAPFSNQSISISIYTKTYFIPSR